MAIVIDMIRPLLQKIINKLNSQKVVIIPFENLDQLLSAVEIVVQRNTYFSDMIRILKYKEIYMIQEKTIRDEIAIRTAESLKSAQDFIQRRMEIYENMWNGCGCKVNYYD